MADPGDTTATEEEAALGFVTNIPPPPRISIQEIRSLDEARDIIREIIGYLDTLYNALARSDEFVRSAQVFGTTNLSPGQTVPIGEATIETAQQTANDALTNANAALALLAGIAALPKLTLSASVTYDPLELESVADKVDEAIDAAGTSP